RLWDPRTGFLFVDGPFDATNADLTIHLPPAARPRPLRGRVVDSSGQPVPGARAGVAYCVYVGRSGGTMWEDAGLVAVDADGRFELANAPAGGDGVLVAEDAYGRRCYVPLVAIDDFATEIVLRLPGIRGWLWLLPDLADPDLPVTFVDAAGRPLRFTVRDAVGVRPAWRHVVGGPTTVALPDGAVAVVIAAGTAFERRVELDAETTHVHVRGAR
ncbi:MAG: carboxypeptidase regulatory-like domain-containing protein, partial [Planctomycetes bacterium]|nr:carboxypeptidase regulatory-like domain-containing protein [Planctomycetota bacterium]